MFIQNCLDNLVVNLCGSCADGSKFKSWAH